MTEKERHLLFQELYQEPLFAIVEKAEPALPAGLTTAQAAAAPAPATEAWKEERIAIWDCETPMMQVRLVGTEPDATSQADLDLLQKIIATQGASPATTRCVRVVQPATLPYTPEMLVGQQLLLVFLDGAVTCDLPMATPIKMGDTTAVISPSLSMLHASVALKKDLWACLKQLPKSSDLK